MKKKQTRKAEWMNWTIKLLNFMFSILGLISITNWRQIWENFCTSSTVTSSQQLIVFPVAAKRMLSVYVVWGDLIQIATQNKGLDCDENMRAYRHHAGFLIINLISYKRIKIFSFEHFGAFRGVFLKWIRCSVVKFNYKFVLFGARSWGRHNNSRKVFIMWARSSSKHSGRQSITKKVH